MQMTQLLEAEWSTFGAGETMFSRLVPNTDFANPTKTWLVVKEEHLPTASEAFHNTGVQVTSQGKRYLGVAALGTGSFAEAYVGLQVEKWVTEIERLASIASSQPHDAYAALTHGLAARGNYVACTILDIGDLLDPVVTATRHKLLLALC